MSCAQDQHPPRNSAPTWLGSHMRPHPPNPEPPHHVPPLCTSKALSAHVRSRRVGPRCMSRAGGGRSRGSMLLAVGSAPRTVPKHLAAPASSASQGSRPAPAQCMTQSRRRPSTQRSEHTHTVRHDTCMRYSRVHTTLHATCMRYSRIQRKPRAESKPVRPGTLFNDLVPQDGPATPKPKVSRSFPF